MSASGALIRLVVGRTSLEGNMCGTVMRGVDALPVPRNEAEQGNVARPTAGIVEYEDINMTPARAREPGNATWLLLLPLVLAGCASSGGGFLGTREPSPPPSPAFAPPPPNMNVVDFVGRWGYAAYHKDADRPRTEVAARGQCNNAYTIGRGPTGGVMMHLPDAREPQELRLKQGVDGKIYLGPEGPAPDVRDREVINFDGRMLILRQVDPETAGRYGTSVYVRCGAPATAAAKRKAG